MLLASGEFSCCERHHAPSTLLAAVQYLTPLRYPGGKGRLTQYVADLMVANDLVGGHYMEAFAGGAAVALSLLDLEYASHVHINDLNRSVHAFWRAVLDQPDELCGLIKRRRVSIAQWKRQRAVQKDADADPLDLAYSTFFLNRVNRSGIILGGVIGGKEQGGPWLLDARFNKTDLIGRIQHIAELRDRVTLYNMDASKLLSNVLPKLPPKLLCYLDPPYYVKGKGLYEDHYKHEDHAAISSLVAEIEQPWIVSYDNVPQIKRLYRSFRSRTFGLRYSAQDRYEGSEVMFFSPKLSIPGKIVPSRAQAA
jgi:DNA adenine methylase